MSDPNCKYHHSITAISKCEICNALVCLECKNVIRQRHSTTSKDGKSSSSYSTSYDLCPECYADKVKRDNNPIRVLLPTIIFVALYFFAVKILDIDFFIGINVGFNVPFIVVILVLMSPVLGCLCLKGSRRKAEAKRRRTTALNSLHS